MHVIPSRCSGVACSAKHLHAAAFAGQALPREQIACHPFQHLPSAAFDIPAPDAFQMFAPGEQQQQHGFAPDCATL